MSGNERGESPIAHAVPVCGAIQDGFGLVGTLLGARSSALISTRRAGMEDPQGNRRDS